MNTRTSIPNPLIASPTRSVKRMVLYARVSTQEQTRGQYPSCDSQIDELEAFCLTKGWEVFDRIRDPGHRAGTLKRPGLSRLRWLVETEQIDGVICTWYNRLIGSRDFYILDKEFKNHNVQFITIHDPADRNTAAGRLFESMLVTIKTFENEQIGEKVRTKMRMRAEKGMWNGGFVPFGLSRSRRPKSYSRIQQLRVSCCRCFRPMWRRGRTSRCAIGSKPTRYPLRLVIPYGWRPLSATSLLTGATLRR